MAIFSRNIQSKPTHPLLEVSCGIDHPTHCGHFHIFTAVIEKSLVHVSADGTDFTFYNQTIVFNGTYYDGDSVCVGVTVAVFPDGIVEGTEEFLIGIDHLDDAIFVYIIDSDCKLLAWYCKTPCDVHRCDCAQI